MTREEVFKASGPTSGSAMKVKIGVKNDGKITAGDGTFAFQAGAFPGSPVLNACMCAFAPYAIENVRAVGFFFVGRPQHVHDDKWIDAATRRQRAGQIIAGAGAGAGYVLGCCFLCHHNLSSILCNISGNDHILVTE